MSDTVHVLSAQKLSEAERDMLQSISPRLVIVDKDLRGSKAIEEAITPETEVLFGTMEALIYNVLLACVGSKERVRE
jgi:hypothetical protein